MAGTITPRQRVKMVLPVDLAKSLLDKQTKRDLLQNELDTITSSGVDLSSAVAVDFIQKLTESVITASLDCNADMRSVLALAREKGGYDPESCSEIQTDILEASGAVFWTAPTKGTA